MPTSKMLFLVCVLFCSLASACTVPSDCGSTDGSQPGGLCVNSVCQCGFGFAGDKPVDPTSCSLTCSPLPVPDGVAFLNKPTIDVTAVGGAAPAVCVVLFFVGVSA